MEKLKHTKNELKRQKDILKRFTHYLPVLVLKKQQLQVEIIKILNSIEELERAILSYRDAVYEWVELFAEDINIRDLIEVDKINTTAGNIAGIDIPLFESIDFKKKEYDLIKMPLWVDYGLVAVREMLTLKIRHKILDKQLALVREELRITAQRVNLFEKVKIPEAKEGIRIINIFLGDYQTASVVTGKIAKSKIQQKEAAFV